MYFLSFKQFFISTLIKTLKVFKEDFCAAFSMFKGGKFKKFTLVMATLTLLSAYFLQGHFSRVILGFAKELSKLFN